MSDVELVEVQSAETGMRLDRWFKAHYPALAHGALQKLLRTGQVRVDGGRAKANARLNAGQTVRVPPMRNLKSNASIRPSLSVADEKFIRNLVIYRDDHVLAINKPSGLAVQGGTKTSHHVDALLDGLKFEAEERPRLVHRLDKDTSGVLLLARNRASASALGDALKAHEASKTYWALLNGVPSPQRGEIDLPLLKKGGVQAERVQVGDEDDEGAKRAVTRYAVIEPAGSKLCWAALWPLTGRTHQLRVHMAAIGHPVVGDGKYGGREAHPGGEIDARLHLHARKIEIANPSGKGTLKITAELPDHMRKIWGLFGFDPDLAGRTWAGSGLDMSKRLIIFDCDGTLVDSQHLIVAAMERAFDSVKRKPPEREAILGIVGLSLPEAIWRLTDGEDEETVKKIRDGYRDAFGVLRQDPTHNEPMYEGAHDAILQLADDATIELGIATGKSRRGVDKLLERFDLTSCFATIQTADVAPSKPHPGMIEQALAETGSQAADTVMIGDTTFDMEMARNAGVIGVGVSWGYHPVHLLERESVHGIADDYAHLMSILDDLFSNRSAAE